MSRRGRARHFVSRLDSAPDNRLSPQGDLFVLFSWGGGCLIRAASGDAQLNDMDCAILPAQDDLTVSVSAQAFAVDLWVD